MLIASGFPRYFWVEALNTSCYVINRCMIRPILNKTPYELFKGRKPNIIHLRVFVVNVMCIIMGRMPWESLI